MKRKLSLLLLSMVLIVQAKSQNSITPGKDTEVCPGVETVFSVNLDGKSVSFVEPVALNVAPVITQLPYNVSVSGGFVSFNFRARFIDINNKQTFRIKYVDNADLEKVFEVTYVKIKSLFTATTFSRVLPAVTTIVAPRCEVSSAVINFPNVSYGNPYEIPPVGYGTVTNYEYMLPAGWQLGAVISTGSNWIAGNNNVTVTSDLGTGDGGVIRIRPVNTACAPGLAPGQESYVAVSRPAPPLLLNSSAEQICNVGQTTNFTVSGLPPGATVSWSISDPTVASISSTSGSTVTVTKTAAVNAFLTVNATVTHCVFTYPLSKKIALGTGRTTVFFTDKQITCEAGGRPYFNGAAEEFPSATTFEWYAKDMSNNANPFVLKDNGSATADFPLGKGNRFYTIRVKAITPCGTAQTLDSDGLVWAPDCNAGKLTLLLSPNPAGSDEVTVSLPAEQSVSRTRQVTLRRILLCDHTGRVLQTINPTGKTVTLHTAGLKPGIYVIKATDGQQWWTEKLVKP